MFWHDFLIDNRDISSPIRRYADVMVHRLLLESLGLEAAAASSSSSSVEQVAQTAARLNVRNRAAKFAQRASQDLFWSLYITQTQQQRADAIVTAVHDTGVQVLLPTYPFNICVQSIYNHCFRNYCCVFM